MRHLIVGTAGHIDHGKSALVRALTGTDPDRLPAEKVRGITIDLGFADLDLGDGRIASFVDVPGHERFVRHMVAGATGIDCVLLVVAADEGVRPQTREHLAICSLLDIRHGIVVLTKSDLVDAELRQVVELELHEFLERSPLADAPLVHVSSRTGAGLDDLRDTLRRVFERIPERAADGLARLPVDRSFVLRGFGTVVTGTMASGRLEVGEEVEVLPGGGRARVRGLHVHHVKAERVHAGQRVAVNLQGLDRQQAPRGATVARPGTLPVTRRVWARVRFLSGSPESLRRGGFVRFHQGTCERAARLRVLGAADDGLLRAEIRLREDTVLLPGDRFILRRPAPVDTVGGGVIEDVRPPEGRARARTVSLAAGVPDIGAAVLDRLERTGTAGRDVAGLAAELGLPAADLAARLTRLAEDGSVVRTAHGAVLAAVWRATRDQAVAALAAFHRDEPLRTGMSREELRARVARAMSQDTWRDLLEELRQAGEVRLEGERIALAGHAVRLGGEDEAAALRLEARFRVAGLDPPDVAEAAAGEPGRGATLLDLLVARGRLVRIRDGRLFHAEALEGLRRRLRTYAATAATIDVATFKEIAGVTRKNAIPLLEQLDAERVTRRVGNVREILER